MVPSIRKRVRGIEISCKSLHSAPIYDKNTLTGETSSSVEFRSRSSLFLSNSSLKQTIFILFLSLLAMLTKLLRCGPHMLLVLKYCTCCTQCSVHGVHDLGLYGPVFIACGENSITFQTQNILKTDPYYCENCTFICKSFEIGIPPKLCVASPELASKDHCTRIKVGAHSNRCRVCAHACQSNTALVQNTICTSDGVHGMHHLHLALRGLHYGHSIAASHGMHCKLTLLVT